MKEKNKQNIFEITDFLFGDENIYYQRKVKNSNVLNEEQKKEVERKSFEIYKKFEKEIAENINGFFDKDHFWERVEMVDIEKWILHIHKKSFLKNIDKTLIETKKINNSMEFQICIDIINETYKEDVTSKFKEIEKIVNEQFYYDNDLIEMSQISKIFNYYYRNIESDYFKYYTSIYLSFNEISEFQSFISDEEFDLIKELVVNNLIEAKAINTVVYAIIEHSFSFIHFCLHTEYNDVFDEQ